MASDIRVSSLQNLLSKVAKKFNRRDFYPGKIDGVWGMNTCSSLNNFRQAMGLSAKPCSMKFTNNIMNTLASVVTSPPNSVHFYTRVPETSSASMAAGNLDWKFIGLTTAIGIGILIFVFKNGK